MSITDPDRSKSSFTAGAEGAVPVEETRYQTASPTVPLGVNPTTLTTNC